jgi:hypothetical protein
VSRGKRNKEEDEQSLPIEETADASRIDGDRSADALSLRRSWAQLIKRIYEVDPLQCPSKTVPGSHIRSFPDPRTAEGESTNV